MRKRDLQNQIDALREQTIMANGRIRALEYDFNMPTADVVEVVKCKNCKWWDNEDNRPLGYCHAAKHCHYSRHWEIQIYRTTEPDFFCKDGERREGEDEQTTSEKTAQ